MNLYNNMISNHPKATSNKMGEKFAKNRNLSIFSPHPTV
jgi:hypothetical protein